MVVAYRGGPLLDACVASCEQNAPGVPLILVDNSPAQTAASPFAERAQLLPQERNLGFAGGANAGMRAALDHGAPQILLLNEDAELHAGAWDALAAAIRDEPGAGAVQPAIMRPDGTVNSLGNPVHRLGFAWAGGDGLVPAQAENDPALPWLKGGAWRRIPVPIPTFSGAAVLLRAEALREVGLFEDKLYSYYEDVELSLRLRRSGWTLWLEAQSVVTHHHDFRRNPEKFRLLEKNRLWVLLAHLRLTTLLRLAPFLAAAELAVLAQAVRQGWLGQKLAAYPHYVPGPRRWLRLLRRRRELKQLSGGPSDLALFESATWRLPPRTAPAAPARTIRWAGSLRTQDTLVMIPVRDQERELADLVAALGHEVPDADLVVVDNGSKDAGATLAAAGDTARVLRVPFNLGVGGAMRLALRYAVLNGYQQALRIECGYRAADVGLLQRELANGADLVIGSRCAAERPSYPTRLLAWALWLATGRHFTDASSGIRGFSRRMLEFFAAEHPAELLSDTAEATVAACAAGFDVVEVPLAFGDGASVALAPVGYNYARTLLALVTHSVPRRRRWSLQR